MPKIENIFKFDSTAIIAQDVDLVGDVTIGPNCVVHPSCTIVALGPIIFGSNCIIEEQSVICNRNKTIMKIGNNNLFSVGCRVEAKSIGSFNIFESKCKVNNDIEIENYCVIGSGCLILSELNLNSFQENQQQQLQQQSQQEEEKEENHHQEKDKEKEKEINFEIKKIENFTVIFGEKSKIRNWSGEGKTQFKALHLKHIQYLIETLPKFHRIRSIENPSKSK